MISNIFEKIEIFRNFIGDYPVTLFLLIIACAVLFAFISTKFISVIIGYFAGLTRVSWDDKVIKILHAPVFWTITILGIEIATLTLKISDNINDIVQSLVSSILLIIWAGFLLRFISISLHAMSHYAKETSIIRPQTRPLFQNLGYIIIIVVAVYLVFRSWHVDMTAWLASAGIAGIAIGFAAKDTLANLISGVFILADGPYKIGDYVVLESGERGKVTHIGLRSTRLLTRDDVEITIPNAIMGNTQIINESGGPYEKYRIRVKVGVAYGSDIDKVKALLMDIALQEESVCNDPEPRVRFRVFGGSSLDVELLCWVENPELRGRVLDVLNTTIYKTFNREGIEIPYSKHDLYIKEMPDSTTE